MKVKLGKFGDLPFHEYLQQSNFTHDFNNHHKPVAHNYT